MDPNVADEIRFQSVIYLKNHIDRYWRKTNKSYAVTKLQFNEFRTIVDDEKVIIRQNLLHALNLPLPRPWIAMNAYAIGRVARHDFPRFWPDLVTQLLTNLRYAFEAEEGSSEHWRIENVLTALAAVVKELSSVKLGVAVSAFRHVYLPFT